MRSMREKLISFCRKNILWLFLLVVAGISSWLVAGKMQGESWRFAVYMDGRGYYAQLPAYFIYNDPQYKFYAGNTAVKPDTINFVNVLENGKYVNKYFAGEAFLVSPFFGAAHLIAHAAGYSANGFSQPYFYAVAIAAIFYYLLGLFFLWRLLEKFNFRKSVILFVCICFAFGTNLFHYAVYEPSMSHVYSFAAISGFLYLLRIFFLAPSFRKLFLCAFLFGVVALLRPINAVVLLAFPVMAGNAENLRAGFRWITKHWPAVILAMLITGLVGFVQLFIYHWATGNYFVYAYKDEGFNFAHPHFYESLIGFGKGLFVYTPMTWFAAFGLVVMFRRSKLLFFSLFILLALIAWIVSSWHEYQYGFSFGLRAYVDYYALFALAMAFFIDFMFGKKWLSAIAITSCGLVIALYGIQQYQFNHQIIHPGAMDEKSYWKVFLKTGKEYEGLITIENPTTMKESDADFNDMEGNVFWPGMESIASEVAHSGNYASKIDSVNIYSCGFVKYMWGKPMFSDTAIAEVNAFVYLADTGSSCELQVAEVMNDKVFYLEISPLPGAFKPGVWTEFRKTIKIPGVQAENEMIKIYFKRNSGIVYVDDFGVTIKKK